LCSSSCVFPYCRGVSFTCFRCFACSSARFNCSLTQCTGRMATLSGNIPLTVPSTKPYPIRSIHSIHENGRSLELVPQAKFCDQSTIAVWTLLAYICKQPPAPANHHQ